MFFLTFLLFFPLLPTDVSSCSLFAGFPLESSISTPLRGNFIRGPSPESGSSYGVHGPNVGNVVNPSANSVIFNCINNYRLSGWNYTGLVTFRSCINTGVSAMVMPLSCTLGTIRRTYDFSAPCGIYTQTFTLVWWEGGTCPYIATVDTSSCATSVIDGNFPYNLGGSWNAALTVFTPPNPGCHASTTMIPPDWRIWCCNPSGIYYPPTSSLPTTAPAPTCAPCPTCTTTTSTCAACASCPACPTNAPSTCAPNPTAGPLPTTTPSQATTATTNPVKNNTFAGLPKKSFNCTLVPPCEKCQSEVTIRMECTVDGEKHVAEFVTSCSTCDANAATRVYFRWF